MQFEEFSKEEQKAIVDFKSAIDKIVKKDLSNVIYFNFINKGISEPIEITPFACDASGKYFIKPSDAARKSIEPDAIAYYHFNICFFGQFDLIDRCINFVRNNNFFIKIPNKRKYSSKSELFFIADTSHD